MPRRWTAFLGSLYVSVHDHFENSFWACIMNHNLCPKSGPLFRTKSVRSGFPDPRTGQNFAGPEFRTSGPGQKMLVRKSGPADRTNLSPSGIPDHRTGPKMKSVRNSGPTRTDPDQQNFGPVRASMLCYRQIVIKAHLELPQQQLKLSRKIKSLSFTLVFPIF